MAVSVLMLACFVLEAVHLRAHCMLKIAVRRVLWNMQARVPISKVGGSHIVCTTRRSHKAAADNIAAMFSGWQPCQPLGRIHKRCTPLRTRFRRNAN